jgi:hypothetical protein
VVYLATRPVKMPLRARIRAAVAIAAAAYLRWNGRTGARFARRPLEPPTLLMTAACWIGKAYLVGSRRRGAIARLQRVLDSAVARSASGDVSGTTAAAAAEALAAPPGGGRVAQLAALSAESARASRQAGIERHSAIVAGAISEVSTILTLVDPTCLTKVVAIVGRVLQGGLIVHTIWLSGERLHRLPQMLDRIVEVAYHPGRQGPGDGRAPVQPPAGAAPGEAPAAETVAAAALEPELDAATGDLWDALPGARTRDVAADARLASAVERLERASDAITRDATRAGGDASPLVEHDLAVGRALAACLEIVTGSKDGTRNLLAELEAIRASGRALVHARGARGGKETDEPAVELAIAGPAAVSTGSERSVTFAIENRGRTAARDVRVRMASPGGCARGPADAEEVALGDVAPGAAATLEVRLAAPGNEQETQGSLVVQATDAGGAEAIRSVWLRP